MALAGFAFLLAIAPSNAAAASPKPLWQRCDGQSGDLSCSLPRGIGASPLNGHLYIADSANTRNRIDEYTAWGEFVRAWGWGVANGAEELQICTTVVSCQGGNEGGGPGQLNGPQGVAVDSAGNVYVAEPFNFRVQKFDPEGHFILMFGGKVNKTKVEEGKPVAEQNRCPIDPVDVCQKGTEGTGAGEFGKPIARSYVATGASPGSLVYVGDPGRVEVFNPNGTFKENFPDPDGIIASGGAVQALAASPLNGLFVAFVGKADVTRLTAAGKKFCTVNEKAEAGAQLKSPAALAMAANASGTPTGSLYVYDASAQQARQFSASCVDGKSPFAPKEEIDASTGIAAGVACLEEETAKKAADIYVSSSTLEGFVRAYGPAPDKTSPCPKPLLAPEIVAQYAVSVGSGEARLGAQINPRFYADTTYQLQYGTAACVQVEGWEGACVQAKPPAPAPLGAEAVDFPATSPNVFLSGLEPATTYRYRFIANSLGGGPVIGAERGFATFPRPSGQEPCPNDAFRTGLGALLPDCRAYELVSPLDKEGGQILTLHDTANRPTQLSQSAIDGSRSGEKLTYSSYTPFAGAGSAPFTSQYIATREEGVSWSSEAISPPRGTPFSGAGTGDNLPGIEDEFEVFSVDLCNAWLVHNNTTAPPLAPGAPPFNRVAYKRSNCGTSAGSYEALSKVTAPTPVRVQGVTTNGIGALVRADTHLSQDAPTAVGTNLNCESPTPATVSFQWLREGAPIGGATASSYVAKAEDAGKTIQCRIKASGGGSATLADANPVWVIAPYPATAPPEAPQGLPAPGASAPLLVGGAGGQTLTCDPSAEAWGGSPAFAFQWYRDGTAIAGAQASQYTVQAADLANPATFQCEVSATNAGGTAAAASEALMSSPAPPTPAARANMATNNRVVYESLGEGKVRAVCILPDGTQSNGCTAGTANLTDRINSATVWNALSEDGSRIFWTNSPNGEGTIYARIDGEETVQLTSGAARFWTAAADGSGAIVSSAGKLLEVDITDPEVPGTTEIAEGFEGVVGWSEDATLLYFVSTKALTGAAQNSEGATAQEGQPNLYLRDVTSGGEELSFVGTLAAADVPTTNGGLTGLSPVAVEPYEHAVRTSADGQSLAFMSRGSLTGYDNADAASGEADAEVFVYQARTEQLSCASCNPSGGRPAGQIVTLDQALPTAAQLPPIQSQLYASHVLSEEGGRLFFEGVAPLLPSDTNGKIDVYQWEAPGAGTCTQASPGFSAQNEGCLSLISSGKSPQNSTLLDASPTGRDVFFTTGSGLLDYDPGSIDVYDARIEGGLPAPPSPVRPCEGEACQSPPPPPAPLTPASAAFTGQGNQTPANKRCAKGKRRVVRKGRARCVRKRTHAKHGRAAR